MVTRRSCSWSQSRFLATQTLFTISTFDQVRAGVLHEELLKCLNNYVIRNVYSPVALWRNTLFPQCVKRPFDGDAVCRHGMAQIQGLNHFTLKEFWWVSALLTLAHKLTPINSDLTLHHRFGGGFGSSADVEPRFWWQLNLDRLRREPAALLGWWNGKGFYHDCNPDDLIAWWRCCIWPDCI